ncbi:MAG: gliding motility-associated C-terminal domain-containing protein, partial [Cryomorphaceae bacterium]|nr:gliding motility-associated C-terminal domain-containing protein [Cryomorphaceae bacterium]
WFPGGCPDTSYSVELFVDTVPDTFIENIMWSWQSAASLDICPGDSTLLRPNATSFTNDWTYQWEVKYPISTGTWQVLPGQDQEDLVVDTALMPGSAQYRLVINSENCDFTTAPLQVNVIPLPTVTVAPKDSLALCAGDSVLIGATGNGLSYQWTWATGAHSGVSFYAKDPGTYVVEATGPNNCLSYDTLKITQIVVTPNAGPDQVVMPGDVVQLNASGGLQYYWYADKPAYFSDPYNPQAQTRPTSDTTWYYVEVRSALGCWGIDSMMVVQFDPATLLPNLSHVMNVITPNGDGFNDVFDMSEVVQADSCDLVILDRWGAKVYEEARYISGWDGRNAGGDPLPDGTYYYLLLCNGEPRFRGAITVIRN